MKLSKFPREMDPVILATYAFARMKKLMEEEFPSFEDDDYAHIGLGTDYCFGRYAAERDFELQRSVSRDAGSNRTTAWVGRRKNDNFDGQFG